VRESEPILVRRVRESEPILVRRVRESEPILVSRVRESELILVRRVRESQPKKLQNVLHRQLRPHQSHKGNRDDQQHRPEPHRGKKRQSVLGIVVQIIHRRHERGLQSVWVILCHVQNQGQRNSCEDTKSQRRSNIELRGNVALIHKYLHRTKQTSNEKIQHDLKIYTPRQTLTAAKSGESSDKTGDPRL